MLNYLLAYGVSQKAPRFEEIDINDKLALEKQINTTRKKYFDLIGLMDEIDQKLLETKKQINYKSKDIIQEAKTKGIRPNELYSTDEEYLKLDYKQEALRAGKEMISKQITFIQSDLRILNSTFYNKF